MVLCDTNILIHAFNGEEETIDRLNSIGFEQIVLSSITVMELFQGMGNKLQLKRMKRKIQYFDIAEINIQTSRLATVLIENFKLSHGPTNTRCNHRCYRDNLSITAFYL
jgi:predicted nucleic acid-binding protein